MDHHSNQPSPQQLQPMLDAHHATWKWLTDTMAKSLAGIIGLLVFMAIFLL